MSRDEVPEDQAVRDLAPLLSRIAFALESLVAHRMGSEISVATCFHCGCTIVTGEPGANPCPVCGYPVEVK